MKIKILGTRGEIKATAPYHSKHSGVLIDNEILCDLGEMEFLNQNPKYILITHLHPDHAFFVRDPSTVFEIKVPIYAPEAYDKNTKVKKLTIAKKIADHKIIPIPTHHSLKVASQAYIIEKDQEKILYTGDIIWMDKKFHSKLTNLDLVITEASYLRKGGLILKNKESGKLYGHTGIPNLIQLFSKFTQNILLVHFGSWFYEDIEQAKKDVSKLAKEFGVNIIIGYDGLEIDTESLIR